MQNTDKRHIFLTGFMGAGKSKIGRLIAKRLACSFYDSDKLIEEEAGITIREIFETKGEAHFRSLETKAIQKLCLQKNSAIIALGGGANITPANDGIIRQNGISIYIKSSPEAIVERVKHSDKRPLLKLDPGDDFEKRLLNKITDLLNDRSPIYEKADIVFERDGLELEEIVEHLFYRIKEFRDKI